MKPHHLLLGATVGGLFGCAQAATSHGLAEPAAVPATFAAGPAQSLRAGGVVPLLGKGKVKHVVIIFQENRTTDDLFNAFPGADTVKMGETTSGEKVKLEPVLLTAPYDLDHEHSAFNTDYDGGRVDGFNIERSNCSGGRQQCPRKDLRAYAYVPAEEVKPYYELGESYVFANHMFSTQSGPSFPAHQYILSGTSTIFKGSHLRASELPLTPAQNYTGGCDSPAGSLVFVIDESGTEDQQVFPCFDRPTLADLADAKGLTWHWYQSKLGPGLWSGPDAVKHLRYGSLYKTDVVAPPSTIFTDISNHTLANVVWLTPTPAESDHAGVTKGTGPDWVASVVNAIGESSYWGSTAIFVTWDDWGGWYDHIAPPQYNSYELGFRVPLIAIGPYAKKGYISKYQHEFGSILKFTEQVFDLGSLDTTDVRSDNLGDCFDFLAKPRHYVPIKTTFGPDYFRDEPVSDEPVDDDF
jgi:phospholipase C